VWKQKAKSKTLASGQGFWSGATLALDLLTPQFRRDGVYTRSLSALSGYSYTRAGTKYEASAGGVLLPFAANEPGIPAGVGYWSRSAFTNLTIRSEEFANAAWTRTTANISSNAATAPDGSLTADSYTEAGTNATIRNTTAITVTTATTYTSSIFVQRSNFDWVRVSAGDTTSLTNSVRGFFNLGTGVVGSLTTSGTGWTGVGLTITALAGGWYRVAITYTTTGTSLFVTLNSATADGSSTRVTGGTGGTLNLWGAQTVLGADPGPYIPTTTAAASIGADALSFTGLTSVSAWTLFFQGRRTNPTVADGVGWNIRNAGGTNLLRIRHQTGGNIRLSMIDVGSGTSIGLNTANTVTTSNALLKFAATFQSGAQSVCLNGGTVATNATGTISTDLTFADCGMINGAGQEWNGSVEQAVIFPFAMTAAELQALTA